MDLMSFPYTTPLSLYSAEMLGTMSKNGIASIYGYRNRGTVPIYGCSTVDDPCSSLPSAVVAVPCDDSATVLQLENLIESLYSLIGKLFPSSGVTSSLIAEYTVKAKLNPFTYVRFAWINEHPGQRMFSCPLNALHLKDLYLQFGFDWTKDPMIMKHLMCACGKWLPCQCEHSCS